MVDILLPIATHGYSVCKKVKINLPKVEIDRLEIDDSSAGSDSKIRYQ
jgi:hypothetical protein